MRKSERLSVRSEKNNAALRRRNGENMAQGKLIVLEGIDGSGKSSQYRRLCARMESDGIDYNHIVFPRYDKESSALIRMYLAGEFGSHPDDVNAYAASSFYAIDRYAGFKSDWGSFYENGGVIIADRYTTSNAIHQCAKLPRDQWDIFLQWLFHYEYDLLGIPAPDAVIYLLVDPEVSQKLMTGRYEGDESKKDIHEQDLEYQKKSAAAAAYCAGHLGWHTVRCAAGGRLRSVEEIGKEISDILAGIDPSAAD